MSSIASPASSTARRIASTVSDTGGTMSLRPMRDMPTPVSATRSSNFSSRAIGRTDRMRSSSACSFASATAGSPVGSNSGTHTSSTCSNTTRTRIPICTVSGSQPTMLVVSRTRGSSSIATTATTNGGG